jgi:hypothetical protein
MWQTIAADHCKPMGQYTLYVLLVHLEEDRTGRQKTLGRIPQFGAPVTRDVVQHAPGAFWVWHRPGDCTGASGRSRSGISTVDPAA